MLGFSPSQLALTALAALCIGISKGGFNGAGMLAILLMAEVFPVRESTGAVLPMLITADIVAVRAFHAHAQARIILRLLPPALVGVVCGWWLMPRIPSGAFGRLMGILCLILIGLVAIQKILPALVLRVERKRYAWSLGWTAGATTMLANAAGPVMTAYLLACKLPKMEFVGTGAWYFFAVNVFKVPFSASLGFMTPRSLLLNLLAAPLIIGGVLAGRALLRHINQNAFEWIMIALSLLGALRLVGV